MRYSRIRVIKLGLKGYEDSNPRRKPIQAKPADGQPPEGRWEQREREPHERKGPNHKSRKGELYYLMGLFDGSEIYVGDLFDGSEVYSIWKGE